MSNSRIYTDPEAGPVGVTSETVTRILWGDDHVSILGAVRSILESNFELVGATEDGKATLEAAQQLSPDVLVLDVSMPKMTGIELARELQEQPRHPAIVFLTIHRDPAVVEAALETGALGYVLKTSAGRELVEAIEDAVEGRRFVSRALRDPA